MSSDKIKKSLKQLLKLEGNKYCADCPIKGPTWASINIGVFLCLQCAGIHRDIGVHITKVRSTELDTWQEDWVAVMKKWGNKRANKYWEARIPSNYSGRPSEAEAQALSYKLKKFIRDKYEKQLWVAKSSGDNEDQDAEEDEAEEIKRRERRKSRKKEKAKKKKAHSPVDDEEDEKDDEEEQEENSRRARTIPNASKPNVRRSIKESSKKQSANPTQNDGIDLLGGFDTQPAVPPAPKQQQQQQPHPNNPTGQMSNQFAQMNIQQQQKAADIMAMYQQSTGYGQTYGRGMTPGMGMNVNMNMNMNSMAMNPNPMQPQQQQQHMMMQQMPNPHQQQMQMFMQPLQQAMSSNNNTMMMMQQQPNYAMPPVQQQPMQNQMMMGGFQHPRPHQPHQHQQAMMGMNMNNMAMNTGMGMDMNSNSNVGKNSMMGGGPNTGMGSMMPNLMQPAPQQTQLRQQPQSTGQVSGMVDPFASLR